MSRKKPVKDCFTTITVNQILWLRGPSDAGYDHEKTLFCRALPDLVFWYTDFPACTSRAPQLSPCLFHVVPPTNPLEFLIPYQVMLLTCRSLLYDSSFPSWRLNTATPVSHPAYPFCDLLAVSSKASMVKLIPRGSPSLAIFLGTKCLAPYLKFHVCEEKGDM